MKVPGLGMITLPICVSCKVCWSRALPANHRFFDHLSSSRRSRILPAIFVLFPFLYRHICTFKQSIDNEE